MMARWLEFWILLLFSSKQNAVEAEDCGGNLPANPSGEFHNPDVDGDFKYDDNSECIWVITADFDKVVEIQFYYMEIEVSTSCLYDYVQVYDGELGDFLMGQYCGFDTPETLTSSGNVMTVRFKSDASESYYGFGIVYFERNGTSGLRLCGPIQNSLAGLIASVDADFDGLNGAATCTWKINYRDFNKKIQLHFVTIKLHETELCKEHHVKVSDAKTEFGVFCGTELPPLITSIANELFVEFVSDNDVIRYEGFLAVYAAIDADLQCGAIVTEPSGYIVATDRDGDGKYDEDLQCVWVIAAPVGTGIELEFESIDIEADDECAFDSLELYDGSYANEASLGLLCGDVIPVTIKTVSNLLFLEFYSDDSVVYGGFNVTFQHIKGQKLCGPFQTDLGGRLILVNAIEDDGRINCTWKIELTNTDKVIDLYLIIQDIPKTDDCASNHVKVYDTSLTYGTFCGTNVTHTIISKSNMLLVDVYKDGDATRLDVTGYYSSRDPDHLCGGMLSSPTGTVRSVDRDQDGEYDPELFCVWGIVAPQGMIIKLEFIEFGTEVSAGCYYDYLKVIYGVYKSVSSTEDIFCGTHALQPVMSKSNIMFLVMETDVSTHDKGFLANYIFIDAPDIHNTVQTTATTITYKLLDNTQTATPGSLTKEGGTTEEVRTALTTDRGGKTTYTGAATTPGVQTDVSVSSDDVSTPVDDVTRLSGDTDGLTDHITTSNDDVTTSSDDVSTPVDDVTTLSDDTDGLTDHITTSNADVATLSVDVTTAPDDVSKGLNDDSTPSEDKTTHTDHVTIIFGDVTTQSDDSTVLSGHATKSSIDASSKERSPVKFTTVLMTSVFNSTMSENVTGSNLTAESDIGPTTLENVTGANFTAVSAMADMDKSTILITLLLSYVRLH